MNKCTLWPFFLVNYKSVNQYVKYYRLYLALNDTASAQTHIWTKMKIGLHIHIRFSLAIYMASFFVFIASFSAALNERRLLFFSGLNSIFCFFQDVFCGIHGEMDIM